MSDRNRILIIEDDEGIRDGVRILFENEGYEVIEAGITAIEELAGGSMVRNVIKPVSNKNRAEWKPE